MTESYSHQPVLLKEVLEALDIKPQGKYVDGTFGRGGHAREIARRLGAQGRLLVLDKDPQAIAEARLQFKEDARVIIAKGSFAMLRQKVDEQGWTGAVDGILLDLGVSSPQLDDAERGFSFRRDGVLDMRMDTETGRSAAEWIAQVKEQELATVLREYGEERYAKRIARAIVKAREIQPIKTTRQLAAIIAQANPKWETGKDPATRSFQAIRIFINNELEDLKTCLAQVTDLLKTGGRLVIISFHSLEDRIVKRFIREQAKGDSYPAGLPVTLAQLNPRLKPVGKPVQASDEEVAANPRARSSVLRVAEKI
ncbi:MAG: 16S rRNA (cytosine(1402)-N(4))-methyltransferase RsmH [Gammaproteobacteria bacterium]|nr:16S rRNA (cytosine(1402)-N(4))-methyltransferase RsmH [Gammaproteobacteria bacterium]